jgi:hypothetical protein
MKEQKPLRPLATELGLPETAPDRDKAQADVGHGQRSLRPEHPENNVIKASRPQLTMQTNIQTKKHRGRLNRETMKLLGKVLGDYFDHVRQQDVPEQITNLVRQFEERKDREPT